jgi:hypothetical protein
MGSVKEGRQSANIFKLEDQNGTTRCKGTRMNEKPAKVDGTVDATVTYSFFEMTPFKFSQALRDAFGPVD